MTPTPLSESQRDRLSLTPPLSPPPLSAEGDETSRGAVSTGNGAVLCPEFENNHKGLYLSPPTSWISSIRNATTKGSYSPLLYTVNEITTTHISCLSLSLSSFFLSSFSLFFSLSLFQVYLEPLKKPQAFGMIDSSLVRDIFYQIPEICSLHERFLLQISQRTERWHPLQKIGDVFVNTVSWSKTFRSSTLSISLFL